MIKSLIRKLIQRNNCSIQGAITIDGSVITSLQILGGYHKPGITKVGRLSVVGQCNGKKVKVYSVHSSGQGKLRNLLQNNLDDKSYAFPNIVASNEYLIAEEWVYGQSVSALKNIEREYVTESVCQFLNDRFDITSTLSLLNEKYYHPFCYLNDYLIPRLGPWVNWDPVSVFVQEWGSCYEKVKQKMPLSLSHPDLSINNLVYDSNTKKTYFIDNELLGLGHGWILDHLNANIRSSDVVQLNDINSVDSRFVEKTWVLRRVGSAIDAGKFDEVVRLINEHKCHDK